MSEIRIVFDGPPGPQSGRFVETENDKGESIGIGEWYDRPDGNVELRIKGVDLSVAEIQRVSLKERMNRIRRGEPDPWSA